MMTVDEPDVDMLRDAARENVAIDAHESEVAERLWASWLRVVVLHTLRDGNWTVFLGEGEKINYETEVMLLSRNCFHPSDGYMDWQRWGRDMFSLQQWAVKDQADRAAALPVPPPEDPELIRLRETVASLQHQLRLYSLAEMMHNTSQYALSTLYPCDGTDLDQLEALVQQAYYRESELAADACTSRACHAIERAQGSGFGGF